MQFGENESSSIWWGVSRRWNEAKADESNFVEQLWQTACWRGLGELCSGQAWIGSVEGVLGSTSTSAEQLRVKLETVRLSKWPCWIMHGCPAGPVRKDVLNGENKELRVCLNPFPPRVALCCFLLQTDDLVLRCLVFAANGFNQVLVWASVRRRPWQFFKILRQTVKTSQMWLDSVSYKKNLVKQNKMSDSAAF
jgi:hypothetical protein